MVSLFQNLLDVLLFSNNSGGFVFPYIFIIHASTTFDSSLDIPVYSWCSRKTQSSAVIAHNWKNVTAKGNRQTSCRSLSIFLCLVDKKDAPGSACGTTLFGFFYQLDRPAFFIIIMADCLVVKRILKQSRENLKTGRGCQESKSLFPGILFPLTASAE